MKLWEKNIKVDKEIERFTVGDDFILDKKLVKYDCLASIAHAKMLHKIGVLSEKERDDLVNGLREVIALGDAFEIRPEDEDCHTAIEKFLTEKYGDCGKKIHTARSRNDQVLTALRLYEKYELLEISALLEDLKHAIDTKVKNSGHIPIPGYTHMQKAMPTTIGQWLDVFLESGSDNKKRIDNTLDIIDKSPLGSAAGFGVPVFELDQKMTADEMGFSGWMNNPMLAQHTRGKYESMILDSLGLVMYDLNKLATDLILFSTKEFDYVKLPEEFCTGSSIMPQKKNADVLELIRAQYHAVLGEQMKIKSMTANLMSGYHRDLQLTKEPVMKAIEIVKRSLKMITMIINRLKINEEKCRAAMTEELYATEEAYKLVKDGMPFREAYRKIGENYSGKDQ